MAWSTVYCTTLVGLGNLSFLSCLRSPKTVMFAITPCPLAVCDATCQACRRWAGTAHAPDPCCQAEIKPPLFDRGYGVSTSAWRYLTEDSVASQPGALIALGNQAWPRRTAVVGGPRARRTFAPGRVRSRSGRRRVVAVDGWGSGLRASRHLPRLSLPEGEGEGLWPARAAFQPEGIPVAAQRVLPSASFRIQGQLTSAFEIAIVAEPARLDLLGSYS